MSALLDYPVESVDRSELYTELHLTTATEPAAAANMVKEKVLRIYDKDGFRRRAACICVRSDEETEVRYTRKPAETHRRDQIVVASADPIVCVLRTLHAHTLRKIITNLVTCFGPPPPAPAPAAATVAGVLSIIGIGKHSACTRFIAWFFVGAMCVCVCVACKQAAASVAGAEAVIDCDTNACAAATARCPRIRDPHSHSACLSV